MFFASIFVPLNGIPSCFLFPEWFGTEFQVFVSVFVPGNGNPSCFLFRSMIQNGIPRVCFYFCSMVENSEHFSPLRNGSERNSESFLVRVTAGIPPEEANCSVYSVFLGIIFCRKLPTLCSRRKCIHCLGGWRKTQKLPHGPVLLRRN